MMEARKKLGIEWKGKEIEKKLGKNLELEGK